MLRIISVLSLLGLLFFDSIQAQNQDPQAEYHICDNCSSFSNSDGSVNMPLNTYSYGDTIAFEAQDISSDFGPRWIGTANPHYDWHNGIDLSLFQSANNDRGDAILAIEGGTVHTIAGGDGYKYITIDGQSDFGYGHIFHTLGLPQRSGDFILTTLDQNPAIFAIVNLQRDSAISDFSDEVSTVTLTVNGETIVYPVTTNITRSQAIAPIGGSGRSLAEQTDTTGGFPVHVHLYRFRDINLSSPTGHSNGLDPLTIINYSAPTYLFELNTMGEQAGNLVFDYPNGEETIIANLWMNNTTSGDGTPIGRNRSSNYASGTVDIDEVKLMIRKRNESTSFFRVIQGPHFEAKITLGGRTNSQIYPDDALYDNNHEGNWTRTGISPYAYSDSRGEPKDEYYFADIALRIHKDTTTITNCPNNTRYPDGNYNIKAEATDIRNISFGSNEIEVTIDNFQPFIQSLRAEIDGIVIYEKEWTCVGEDGIELIGDDLLANVSYQQFIKGIDLFVETSEPVKDLNLSIPALNLENQSPIAETDEADRNWTFKIDISEGFSDASEVTFHFSAMDLSNNPLLSLQDYATSDAVAIPLRTGAATWSIPDFPTGIDNTHRFLINCREEPRPKQGLVQTTLEVFSEEDCMELLPIVQHVTSEGASDGTINIEIVGGIAPYKYTWMDDEATSITDRTGLPPGEYCLLVNDALCCEQEVCVTINEGCLSLKVLQSNNLERKRP